MQIYSVEEMQEAKLVVSSIIKRCEKAQLKFKEGTSQHSLLRNRIKAMNISESLLKNENTLENYSKEELLQALPPVISIIRKCEKAQTKYEEGTTQFNRFQNIIKPMLISKLLIDYEICKRG